MSNNVEESYEIDATFYDKIGKLVMPGDVVGRIKGGEVLGKGLIQDNENLVATKPGIMSFMPPETFWVETSTKRYVPLLNEMVVGTIIERHGDNYKVDIGCAHQASLPIYAFEGASKKHHPNLQPGDVVYARVVLSNKDMDPELECMTSTGKSNGFGPLKNGNIAKCSISLARILLANNNQILQIIGSKIPYEIAIGLNGKIWLNSNSYKNTNLIINILLNSEGLDSDELQELVDSAFKFTTS
eukprot:TRINITY_DN2758_c0_g1_i1.p1 TRINITY_DN2758_c0_g1~~TRINITY_DN2758_c0_g1_i1.p1  ORF type:complete len:243 (-),score=64.99 TRINITY_DN2758_c0_g1_i1:99-827(-)